MEVFIFADGREAAVDIYGLEELAEVEAAAAASLCLTPGTFRLHCAIGRVAAGTVLERVNRLSYGDRLVAVRTTTTTTTLDTASEPDSDAESLTDSAGPTDTGSPATPPASPQHCCPDTPTAPPPPPDPAPPPPRRGGDEAQVASSTATTATPAAAAAEVCVGAEAAMAAALPTTAPQEDAGTPGAADATGTPGLPEGGAAGAEACRRSLRRHPEGGKPRCPGRPGWAECVEAPAATRASRRGGKPKGRERGGGGMRGLLSYGGKSGLAPKVRKERRQVVVPAVTGSPEPCAAPAKDPNDWEACLTW